MYWLVGAAIAGAIFYCLDESEQAARKSQRKAQKKLARKVLAETASLDALLSDRKRRYTLQTLRAQHRASVQVADEAYREYKVADKTLRTLNLHIRDLNARRDSLEAQRQGQLSAKARAELRHTLAQIREARRIAFSERDEQRLLRDDLRAQVSRLNQRTAKLRDMIPTCQVAELAWLDLL